MIFGMLNYESAYDSTRGEVCISTSGMQPASINWYTRDEILELIASAHNGRKAIYEEALLKFPKETKS